MLLLAILSSCLLHTTALTCTNLEQNYNFSINISSPVSLCIALNSSTLNEAVRILVHSPSATIVHPVLATVRQPRGVISMAVPYIESGYSYQSVERTLCPRLNDEGQLLIDLSTSDPQFLAVTFRAVIVKQFRLSVNSSAVIDASPSGPSYLLYENNMAASARLRVKVQSSENTSEICAIASIQIGFCPVVELLDNPDHRGRYQTMKSIAAINTKVNGNGFFYVVLSVFPGNGESDGCVSSRGLVHLGPPPDNYNPTPYNGTDRTKIFTVTVEPALSDSGYAIAIVISTLIYVSFYIVAVAWIFIFDYWRWDRHFIFQQLRRNPAQFTESGVHDEPGETSQSNEPAESHDARSDSSDEEEENYKPGEVVNHTSTDTPDFSLHSTAQKVRESEGQLSKRPSLLSVLVGTHLNAAVDDVTPPSSHVPFQYHRSRHNSETYTPTSPFARTRYISESLGPTQQSRLHKRQKSSSESHSPRTAARSLSINLARHISRNARTPNSSPGTGSHRVVGSEGPDLGPPEVVVSPVEGSGVHRQDSYENAVTNGENETPEPEEGATITEYFPVNSHMAELGDIDDSPYVQKKYNQYALYLLIIVVFYSIPAYQLVITYQRLVTTSGNEDICYYNSLCSHPWDLYDGLSLSAFNNIYSNIGFFILGFLYILIAYRRRLMYRPFERLNCNKDTVERVGIPQHFGIYYAVGLALMAEALMSVAYHICPSSSNYQFDTTFMYILAALGLHKLLESRCPDLDTGLHKIMLTLAFIIVVVVVGVLYADSVVFWVLFFLVYVVFAFVFSVEVYYRWQIKPRTVKHLFIMYKKEGICPPKHIPKFVMALVSIAANWLFAVLMVAIMPSDFGTMFLFILLSNFLMYLLYYTITKMVYKELPSVRPLIFVIFAMVFWSVAIFFYTRSVTDWNVSPALSRDNNSECLVLGFYDAHDMWHFLSAFALFFSFLMLMTLDDKQENQKRTELRVF